MPVFGLSKNYGALKRETRMSEGKEEYRGLERDPGPRPHARRFATPDLRV